jgi:hypothetical protein
VHHHKYGRREGMLARFLCEQDVLRDIAQTHRITDPATSESDR